MRRWITHELERTIYVIGGLPIAIRGASLPGSPAAQQIRRAFAQGYWHPQSVREASELLIGLFLTPIVVPLAALWFTLRNGRTIRRREGKSARAQFFEQLTLYALAGTVGPWYYILSLYRDGIRRAPSFLQRCETKRGIYALIRDKDGSPLQEKDLFALRCAEFGVPAVACELVIDGTEAPCGSLPDCDLFVKPLKGCGGKGAERWDRVGSRLWSNGSMSLGDAALIDHLRGRRRKLIVQKRLRPHADLLSLTSGAVPTVRMLTCLDEAGVPEIVAAVFRMSIGRNRTVDNIHAGGLACAVSLLDGRLGIASNLGADARLGWCRDHPTTGARIEGNHLPQWRAVKKLAVSAHEAFADWVLIGWDIAITDDGPVVIEGNRSPDMDLMQRFMDVGFCGGHALTDLIAHHLWARGHLGQQRPGSESGLMLRMDARRQ